MYIRAIIYGLITIGAMLLAGCSQDDVMTTAVTPGSPVAISFMPALTPTLPEGEGTTRAGQTGAMNSEDLRTTGFGVFASLNSSKTPDMMFNQEVSFTFVGDIDKPVEDSLKGYWSYQPLKYWPNDLTKDSHFYISAYAPYQNQPIADPETTTGIYGLSENNESPYIDYRRCEKPEEVVDLLWYYEEPKGIPAATDAHAAGTLAMKMHHALARLEINVKLASAPAAGTKVLVEKITLTGLMAKTGKLHLYEQTTTGSGDDTKYYPVWSEQTNDMIGELRVDHTFTITNKENDPDSYGIIDPAIRYIEGMPYDWQPEGLKADNPETSDKDEGLQNALSTGDRKTYVYLIPQDEALSLTVKVKCHKKTASDDEVYIKTTKTTDSSPITIANPLKGNTTYTLNLTLSGI
jgi:hypothetical protein